jgi:hypothetical protein
MATSRGCRLTPAADRSRHGLQDLRRGLLDLHKALIEAERITYERIFGRIPSNGQLLQLVMHDPWFTWLRPLSQLVVRLDEVMDQTDRETALDVQDLVEEVRTLLCPSEQSEGFERSYYEALQRSPEVVLAHSRVKHLLSVAGQ